tara:strand:+ start:92 stop:364 length:273 start_codon:yes stop_codon:yes gene_type:complete
MSVEKITVDGNEYVYDELTDEQKYVVTQITSINAKIQQNEFEVNQLKAALNHFNVLLSALLKKSEEPEQLELPLGGQDGDEKEIKKDKSN